MSALLSGEVRLLVAGVATILPHLKSGKTKALAVTGAKRSPGAPELPTVSEAGVPGFEFDVWYGFLLTAERFSGAGLEPAGDTLQKFSTLMREDVAKIGEIVRVAGIKPE